MTEEEREQVYYAAVEKRRAMAISDEDANLVAFEIGRVTIVFVNNDKTSGETCWAVWDENLDGEKEGFVWIGEKADLESDKLERPPGAAYWALQDAIGRAAIRAVRDLGGLDFD